MEEIRVLIVEDEPRIAELHRRFTEKMEGFEILGIANSLADAEDMVDILEPDLVLLDLFFPEGSGMELLRKIRSKGGRTDLILITAAKEMATLQEALRGGVFDYIIKPVDLSRFRNSLQKYRDYFRLTQSGGKVDQKEVDRLLHSSPAAETKASELPKGVDPLTLEKIRKVVEDAGGEGLSAEAVGERSGVSRSTARRYLEFLVGSGALDAELAYGTVGRPERRYFCRG